METFDWCKFKRKGMKRFPIGSETIKKRSLTHDTLELVLL
jgi:hypothetical protein